MLDVNDNWPTFTKSQLRVRVKEDSVVGSVVYQFAAFDADIGLLFEISYNDLNEKINLD